MPSSEGWKDYGLGTVTRNHSGQQTTNLSTDLRHDVQGSSWAVGGSVNWSDFAPVVRLDEIAQRGGSFAFVGAFVENKDVAGLTARIAVKNIANRQNFFDRTVFVDRSAGIVYFVEDRDRSFGTIFTFEIEGSF